MVRRIFFDIPTIKNQVDKRQLTFIGKLTRNSDEQLPKKFLMEQCNNKWNIGSVLHSNEKTLVHNIALILPTVDRYGSLKLWAHLALDGRYRKYLINVIGNTPTPPPVPPPSPNTKKAQPPSTPYTTCPSQATPTFYLPMQSKIP